jgi:hypothetical protein
MGNINGKTGPEEPKTSQDMQRRQNLVAPDLQDNFYEQFLRTPEDREDRSRHAEHCPEEGEDKDQLISTSQHQT